MNIHATSSHYCPFNLYMTCSHYVFKGIELALSSSKHLLSSSSPHILGWLYFHPWKNCLNLSKQKQKISQQTNRNFLFFIFSHVKMIFDGSKSNSCVFYNVSVYESKLLKHSPIMVMGKCVYFTVCLCMLNNHFVLKYVNTGAKS